MLRNAIIALMALGAVGAVSPTPASARGGFHHFGGFHHGGFGFYAPFGYGYPYAGYIPYEGDLGVCYETRQRVKMPYGWRIRRTSICE